METFSYNVRPENTYSLEEVHNLKLIARCGRFSLDLGVGVIDDSEEHVE